MDDMLRSTTVQATDIVDNHINQLEYCDGTGTNEETHRTTNVTWSNSNMCSQYVGVITNMLHLTLISITYQTQNKIIHQQNKI